MNKINNFLFIVSVFIGLLNGFAMAGNSQDNSTNSSKISTQNHFAKNSKIKKLKPAKKQTRFEQCDQDSNGSLSLEEYMQCFPSSTPQQFKSIDADNNGFITEQDMNNYQSKRKYSGKYSSNKKSKKAKQKRSLKKSKKIKKLR